MSEQNNQMTSDEQEKVLGLSELKPGDILIFDTDGSPIDVLITSFTNSNATHGALFVQNGENALLADSGFTGIDLHQVAEGSEDNKESRIVHVRRITKEGGFGDDFDNIIAPVVKIANDYVREDLPYPYSDLVLLAMILIYKDVSDVNLQQAVVIKLLKLVTAEIKKIIDDKFHDGKYTMVCSSFVYQCYLDASKDNPDLKLIIENGDVQANLKKKRSATLFDLYAEHAAEYNFETKRFAESEAEPVKESIDELLKNLVDKKNENHVSLIKSNALSNAIEEFLKVLLKAAGITIHSIKELIENAKMQQAMFITPNDLYCHTTNTVSVGKILLYRNGDEYKPQ
jgi:hypothetical protein